jgi:hypothetical protein
MSSCTRRSGGGLIESLRRAKKQFNNISKSGASPNQIKAAENKRNALQKQFNDKNSHKAVQIMF